MKVPFYLLTLFLGVVLAVHLAMNGKVGSVLNNARVGNALFWCIGALGAVVIGFTGWESGALEPLKDVHPLLLTAGLFGATLVSRILESQFYGVDRFDAWTLGITCVLLISAGLFATWLPARRIARTDPMSGLRAE